MKSVMKSMLGVQVTAMVLTAALVGSAPADQQVPFKGSLHAVEVDVVQPPTLVVDGSGTGTATHLGRFAVTYHVDVNLATGGGPASIHLVAANGEDIVATGSGQGTPTDDPEVASIVETYVITGGTGRFADASGSFIVRRLVNTTTGVTSGSFEGTIEK